MADTRKDKRAPVALKVRFKSATVDEFIEQYSTDVSRGGIFIKSGRPMKIGTLLKFQFQLKDESTLIRGVGRVVWTREDSGDPEAPAGMGIKFIKMDSSSETVLERVLSSHPEGENRFDAGAAEDRAEALDDDEESEPPSAFFPSTSSESDMPPPEDRTAVRHASEFLAGALSGMTDANAAREAQARADAARKRTAEIEASRDAEAEAHATALAAETESQPSILIDPTLAEAPKAADPEKDIVTEVGNVEQLAARMRAEAAAKAASEADSTTEASVEGAQDEKAKEAEDTEKAKEAEDTEKAKEAEEAREEEAPKAAKAEAQPKPPSGRDSTRTPQVSEPAPAPESQASSGPNRTVTLVVIAAVMAAAGFLAMISTSGNNSGHTGPEATPVAAPEPEVAPVPEPEVEPEPEPEPEPEAEPEPEVPVEMVERRVSTVPPGAEVYVEGELRGTAPLTLELPLDVPVTVRAKAPGRAEVSEEVTGQKKQSTLRLALPPLPYVLSVTTTPPGAQLRAGRGRGTSPAELDLGVLSGGRVQVTARLPGYNTAREMVPVGQFEEHDGAMRKTLELTLSEAPEPTRPTRAKPATQKEPAPQPEAKPAPAAKPEAAETPKPVAKPASEAKPAPEAEPTPDAKPTPEAKPAEASPPKPDAKPAPAPAEKPAPAPAEKPAPAPAEKPEAEAPRQPPPSPFGEATE